MFDDFTCSVFFLDALVRASIETLLKPNSYLAKFPAGALLSSVIRSMEREFIVTIQMLHVSAKV